MRVLLGYGNNRRNQRLIVIAGHRTTVCARNRHRKHVTTLNVGRKTHLVDDDIARFAVHADHTAQLGFAGTLTIGDFRSVIRSVQCRANIVAHTAVNRHVHAFRNRISGLVFRVSGKLNRLDRAHAIQGDAGRSDRPTARLERNDRSGHAKRAIHGGDRIGKAGKFRIEIHGILAIGVGHGIAAAQVNLRQCVCVGGVEGLAQQHHALRGLNEGVRIVNVRTDMRMHADQFEHVLMAVDLLQYGERGTISHHGHGFGEFAVAFGNLLVAHVVRVFDVVLQLAFCAFAFA